ncbi:hypothetical protein HID58_007426 [Brassica napus]|uniref:BnaA02g30500D protein n=2 Tax=Brassica napus TaxID=3708 RepID=A0A078H8R1_BRANA|nr:hypothetical protein HID58_007426 [Brassica napus]CDY33937.1 BnaA02g30500D [Brassica napus]
MTESSIGLMLQRQNVSMCFEGATWKTETEEVVTITSNSLEEHNFGKSYKEEERKSKKMKHNCMKYLEVKVLIKEKLKLEPFWLFSPVLVDILKILETTFIWLSYLELWETKT